MSEPLREKFLLVTMRFKRFDVCPVTSCLQQSELVVMAKAAAGCCACEKGASVSDIQQNLHISKPAVSQTLNSLEQKGYILRTIDLDDRRKIMVTLTPEGQVAFDKAQCIYQQALDDLLLQFGTQNTKQLITLINQLMDIIEKKGGI